MAEPASVVAVEEDAVAIVEEELDLAGHCLLEPDPEPKPEEVEAVAVAVAVASVPETAMLSVVRVEELSEPPVAVAV